MSNGQQRRSRSVAIFDLDHGTLKEAPTTLLADGSSLAVLADRLAGAGGPLIGPLALRATVRSIAGTKRDELRELANDAAARAELAPHAVALLEEHRAARRRLVAITRLPMEAAEPFAEALGFDAVIATRLGSADGAFDGTIEGPVVSGRGKLDAARQWASDAGASLRRSYYYAGAFGDAPLLAEVGRPVVVDPDARLAALAWLKGWPTRSLFAPSGVPTIARHEIQDLGRPFARPELVPYASFQFEGLENIPSDGPAIVCGNHRSYFDSVAVGLALMQTGRTARFLGKKEVFDAPLVGQIARWIGGIRVERGTGSDEPLEAAAEALRAGELIGLMPQGTIPRGPAFFEPELQGRWGAAKLAAMTRAPVIPLGVWGTEKVWPRSARIPNLNPVNRPLVTITAGPPVKLSYDDPDTDTKAIMAAIVDLLPDEARVQHDPTPEELAKTYPAGYKGDPDRELERRPGTD